jgi:mono/diheme cytochrome c family protein
VAGRIPLIVFYKMMNHLFTVIFAATLSTALLRANETAVAAQVESGQKVYMMVCFACHQPTGLGMPNMFPPLAGSDWATAPKPDRIIRMVLQGYTGPITINGKPFTSLAPLMPSQATLSDKQIADALTFVRNSFGNKASAVSADEVAAIRASEKRTAPWTEADIKQIADR